MKNTTQTLLTLLTTLALAGCPSTSGDDGDMDTETGDEVGEFECDPVGAIPEVGALINAPVDDDVEIIVKTPQHPDAPGPEGLP